MNKTVLKACRIIKKNNRELTEKDMKDNFTLEERKEIVRIHKSGELEEEMKQAVRFIKQEEKMFKVIDNYEGLIDAMNK